MCSNYKNIFEFLQKAIRSIKKCQTTFLLDSKIPREDNPVFDELCLTMELMLLACRLFTFFEFYNRTMIEAKVADRDALRPTPVINANVPLIFGVTTFT